MTDFGFNRSSIDEDSITLVLQIREIITRVKEVGKRNEVTIRELTKRGKLRDSFKGCNSMACDPDQIGASKPELESLKDKLNINLQNLLAERNMLQALASEKSNFTRKVPAFQPSKASSKTKRLLFEKMSEVLNDEQDDSMPVVKTEADSPLLKSKFHITPSHARSKTEIFNNTNTLSEENLDLKLDRINNMIAQYSSVEESMIIPGSLKYDSNLEEQSISLGGNAILTEAKAGLVSLQELNNQLRNNLLRLNGLKLKKQFAFKAGSCPGSPTSKGERNQEREPNFEALKAYISHLQEAITNLIVETSQERTLYREKIRVLELSLESTIKRYENKLKQQKFQPVLDPEVLEELKKITRCNQSMIGKDCNEYSKEEISIMHTLKELSKKPAEPPKGMKEYRSLNVSLCSSPKAAFTNPAGIHVQPFAPNLSKNMSQLLNESIISPNFSRRSSQNTSINYEDIKNAMGEGPTRGHINFLSQNLLSKINVLETASQKQNDIDSQLLLNRKKQELVLTSIKGTPKANRESRKVLGIKEANQAISDLSISSINSISVAKNKENDECPKKCPEESYDYIQSLEREIEALKTRLVVCERNLINKVYEGDESEITKLKEKEMNEKKRMIAVESKKTSLRKRLVELEREKIDRKKQELASASEKIISAIESHTTLLKHTGFVSAREAVAAKARK